MRGLGCGCFPLLAAALLLGGGQGLWTALRNREPTVLTCAEWIAQRPSAGWVRLTDCELLVEEATYESFLGGKSIRKAWIPARAPGVDGPTPLVLRTKDEAITGMMEEMLELADAMTKAEAGEGPMPDIDAWTTAHAADMRPTREISGLVAWGMELDSDEYEEVAAIGGDVLAEDFVVVEEGEAPALAFSAGATAAGLVFAALSVATIVGRFRREP